MPHEQLDHHGRRWLLYATLLFIGLLVVVPLLVMLLNGGMVNHVFSPLAEFLPMFHLIWQEQPWDALWFISDKSLFAVAHLDGHSGLNHWTVQFDAQSLLGYAVAATLGARAILRHTLRHDMRALGLSLAAMAGLVFSLTYMTSIAHCSGPTWAGFVSAYGLGFEKFEMPPYWQLLIGIPSLAALIYWDKRRQRDE